MAALEKELEALRTYARLAILSYDNGYSSYIEVLDAETSLFSAELNYVQVLGTFYTSMVDIYKSMGGGWVVQTEGMTEASNNELPGSDTSELPEPTAKVETNFLIGCKNLLVINKLLDYFFLFKLKSETTLLIITAINITPIIASMIDHIFAV